MATVIITDSTSDITQQQAKAMDLEVLPMPITFSDGVFLDGIDITPATFYDKLVSSEKLPTTSQIPPLAFEERFRYHKEQGNEVVCILLASQLSGTYQSAEIAKSNCKADNVTLIDTGTVAMGLSVLVRLALKLRGEGKTAAEIVAAVEAAKKKVVLFACIDTLTYLQKGGRLGTVAATLGTFLNLKPIIQVLDGKVQVIHKIRGIESAIGWMLERVKETPINLASAAVIAHSNAADQLDLLVKQFRALCGNKVDVVLTEIGSTIGTHAGPGAVGLGYLQL